MNTENHRYRELADFLKTRRAKILPEQVGLPADTRRRTPGLRREEVAQLAGVGLTWYTWLEQGRDIHVSAAVIESLCRVLLLNRQERIHLYLLANQPLPSEIPGQETVSPVLQHVLDSMAYSPCLVTDQRWNVIAWNRAACLVLGCDFTVMNQRERNIVWGMFTDEAYKSLYVDWNMHAQGLLARFRSTLGQCIEDPWLAELIEDLKTHSPEFCKWWPLHEITGNSEVFKQLNHPVAGLLDYEVCNFDVSGNSGLKMLVHTPVPGTDTEAKMKTLLGAE